MLTLFAVMVGNNWNSYADMYCSLVGNNWPRVYFTTFYMTTIMIMLNIVISFVLEIYSVSLEDSRTKTGRIHKAKIISQYADTEEKLKELIRKAAEYDRLT